MSLSKLALDMANKLRPVLTKIIPASVLSGVKARIVEKHVDNLKNVNIEPFDKNKNLRGVNLIGNIRGDNGLGQSMRLVADILAQSKEEFTINNFYVPPGGSMQDRSYDHKLTQTHPYGVNLIHVNASEFSLCYMDKGRELWDYRYNIAYWLWELEDFPEQWLPNICLADEIWTPADFITNTLKKYTDKPVVTVPYCVTAPTDDAYDRKHFGLPEDKFLFLMMFDSGSVMERKNPLGTIESFKKAFRGDNEDVGIVIKINELEQSERDIEYIHSILDGYDNIYIITGTFSKTEVNSLTKCVDVFVSLHRAEGFGLVLAEAMLVGTPTIATNWSANTEFMNSDVACMVDYKMIDIGKDIPPFKKEYRWADADVNQAAEFMKRLYEDKEYYQGISKRAEQYVRERLSMDRSVKIVEDRLQEIYGQTRAVVSNDHAADYISGSQDNICRNEEKK